MDIAFATDAGYLPWTATAIRSVLDRVQPPPTVHLLHLGDIGGPDLDRLRAMVAEGGGRLEAHAVARDRLAGLPAVDRFGMVVWLRLLLPELLPDAARVLYLDADTLVLEPLDALWSTDLGGALLGAVSNVVATELRTHVATIAPDGRFFNSGVLLIDLDLVRTERAFDAVVRYARAEDRRLVWPDQDALNAGIAGRWTELHPRWNAQNSLWTWADLAVATFGAASVEDATAHPAILHFEGPSLSKPWHFLSRHPWRAEYLRTLRSTPWAATPLEDRTAATRLINRMPAARQLAAYRRLHRWRAR